MKQQIELEVPPCEFLASDLIWRVDFPLGSKAEGDLYALFSCGGERVARIVLADSVGHGLPASLIVAHVHWLIHQFRGVRDSSNLLAALNDEFTLAGQPAGAPLRLTTVVTATFDRDSGELNYAYAAHPRMMLWRGRKGHWYPLGEGLGGYPLALSLANFTRNKALGSN